MKFYCSKNTVDSEITEYSTFPPEVQNNIVAGDANQAINVSDVQVSQDVVEKALVKSADNNVSLPPMPEVSGTAENTVATETPVSENVEAVAPTSVPEEEAKPLIPVDESVALGAEDAPVEEAQTSAETTVAENTEMVEATTEAVAQEPAAPVENTVEGGLLPNAEVPVADAVAPIAPPVEPAIPAIPEVEVDQPPLTPQVDVGPKEDAPEVPVADEPKEALAEEAIAPESALASAETPVAPIAPPIEPTTTEEIKEEMPAVPAVEETAPVENTADGNVPNTEVPVADAVAPNAPAEEVAPVENAVEGGLLPNTEVPVADAVAPIAPAENTTDGNVPNTDVPVADAVAPIAPAEEAAPVENAVEGGLLPDTEVPVADAVAPIAPAEEAAPVENAVEGGLLPNTETPVAEVQTDPTASSTLETVAQPMEVEGSLLPKAEEGLLPTAPEENVTNPQEQAIETETGGDLIDRSLQDLEGGNFEETPDNEIDTPDDENVDLDETVEDSSLDDLFHTPTTEDEVDHRFENSVVHSDKIVEDEDEFDDHFDEDMTTEADSIMTDVAKSMSALIQQNRELKTSLAKAEDKLGKVVASRRNLADKNTMLEKKLEALTTKLRGQETALAKAEVRAQTLEAKNLDQERVIESQARELEAMRPQLQGKEDLVSLLADAQVLLGDEEGTAYHKVA